MRGKRGRKVEIDMVQFRRDVEMGATILTLAEKYAIAKSTVWRLRRDLGPVPDETPAEDSAEENPDVYNLTVTVPTERLGDLINALSDEEIRYAVMQLEDQPKADIFMIVLQRRLDEALRPSIELPKIAA